MFLGKERHRTIMEPIEAAVGEEKRRLEAEIERVLFHKEGVLFLGQDFDTFVSNMIRLVGGSSNGEEEKSRYFFLEETSHDPFSAREVRFERKIKGKRAKTIYKPSSGTTEELECRTEEADFYTLKVDIYVPEVKRPKVGHYSRVLNESIEAVIPVEEATYREFIKGYEARDFCRRLYGDYKYTIDKDATFLRASV